MKHKNNWLLSALLIIVLIGISLFIIRENKDIKEISINKEETTLEVIDWVKPPKDGEYKQPDGMGKKRTISQDSTSNNGMASIKINKNENKNIITVIDDEKVIEAIEEKVEEVEDGKYRLMIDWYDYDLSSEDYYVLLSIIGEMYKDEVNKDSDNYNIIVKQPNIEDLREIGIPVFFDIDSDGYLTVYCDIITQDIKAGTEIEEIKEFTVYYEGDILTFKR